MALKVTVESDLRDENPEPKFIEQGELFFHHDIIIGRLIMGQSLGDGVGALVHLVDGVNCKTANLTPNMIAALARPRYLHKELLPWVGIQFPIHLDNGEPANLTMRHRPDIIVVDLFRGEKSFD